VPSRRGLNVARCLAPGGRAPRPRRFRGGQDDPLDWSRWNG